MSDTPEFKADPCPWHRDTIPVVSCYLGGCRDEPVVYIKLHCPKCGAARVYAPTEKEVQKHYENRYSQNLRMIRALAPKLAALWNWQHLEPKD